jgi:DNA repair protein RecO (recombination protein O)
MGGVIDQAICLRTWDWSETSQTALLFLRRLGALRVLAKGSRRAKAPFSAGLEVATRGEVRVFPRHGAGLSTLASWDLEERYQTPRASLEWFHASLYAVEVVSSSLTELDPHPSLFDALDALLGTDPASDPIGSVVELQWAALTETGHQPELVAPPAEQPEPGALNSEAVYWFAPLHGSLVTDARGAGEIWRVRSQTVELLRSLARQNRVAGGPITRRRAARMLDAYLRFALGAELRSFEAVESTVETGGLPRDR